MRESIEWPRRHGTPCPPQAPLSPIACPPVGCKLLRGLVMIPWKQSLLIQFFAYHHEANIIAKFCIAALSHKSRFLEGRWLGTCHRRRGSILIIELPILEASHKWVPTREGPKLPDVQLRQLNLGSIMSHGWGRDASKGLKSLPQTALKDRINPNQKLTQTRERQLQSRIYI